MRINNQFRGVEQTLSVQGMKYHREGEKSIEESDILCEHILDIYLNERLTMRLVCTPEYLAELALGRLLTEGIVRSIEEISYLYLCRYGKHARFYLDKTADNASGEHFVEITPSCCTGNRILDSRYADPRAPRCLRHCKWEPAWIYRSADFFFNHDTPIHERTHATHSCFLLDHGSIGFFAEDIGRHNAIDKVVGHALLERMDMSGLGLFTSGRIPTDMILKVIRSGVPLLISKESPTREAIELARQYHLTLIGNAKPDSFVVYSESESNYSENELI